MKYGESKSLNDYDQEPSFWNGISLNKVEFWAYQYDFSFNFGGRETITYLSTGMM